VRGEAVPPFVPVPNRGMITLSIMLANIMQGLDNTILNVALPHIQGSLSASLDQIAWALTSYIVCCAIMMPLTGWLAGRFGIKYVFLVSVASFTVASGTQVTIVNDGPSTHTWTSDSGAWDSGALAPGSTYAHTFSTPGTFGFRCSIHPVMQGSVTVS